VIGKVIGNRYEIITFLGRGGMAWVYKATDRKTGTPVALKVLYPQFSDDSSYIERFIREAKLALTLDHPNIVRMLDYGADRDTHYLVMEFIEGQDLKEVLRERGSALDVVAALQIARQVAFALQQAYAQGIVHRDIKPQNLMQAPDDTIKVLDFGIARAEDFVTITGSGFVGSPYYIAPEQAMSQAVDIRSDIYALGVVLYEMLTGRLPFDAETPWSIISQHISHVPLPVSDIRREVPRPVAELVSKMLAKHPNERFQTPEALIAEIDILIGQLNRRAAEEKPPVAPQAEDDPEKEEAAPPATLPELEVSAEQTSAAPEPPAAGPTETGAQERSRALLGVVLAGLLVLAGVGWWGVSRGHRAPAPPTPAAQAVAGVEPSPTRGVPTASPRVSPTAPAPSPTTTPAPVPEATTAPLAVASVRPLSTSTARPTRTATPTHTATPTRTPTASPTATPGRTATLAPKPRPVVAAVPTHNRIAFKSDVSGSERILIMNADGSRRQYLPDRAVYDAAIAAIPRSPDNLREALVRFLTPENTEIFIRWLDNRGPETPLGSNPALDYDPAWSPDGVHVAFVSRRQGSDDIFVIEVPGRNDRQVTNMPDSVEKHPAWSPDGSQIVFWSDREVGKKQIWVINADGTNPHRLSNGQSNDWDPVWLP